MQVPAFQLESATFAVGEVRTLGGLTEVVLAQLASSTEGGYTQAMRL